MIILSGLVWPLVNCLSPPDGQGAKEEHMAALLTEAKSVRTQRGEHLAGYLVEYDWNFETLVVFATLENPRYEQGERVHLIGRFTGDSVRMSYGHRIDADFPVFEILRAEPAKAEKQLPPAIPPFKKFNISRTSDMSFRIGGGATKGNQKSTGMSLSMAGNKDRFGESSESVKEWGYE